MTLIPPTLAGRFFAVIVGSVFVSQALVFSLLLFETDDKIDQYEQTTIVDRIATIFRYSRLENAENRQRIVDAATNVDEVFLISQNPQGALLKPIDSGPFSGLLDTLQAPVLFRERSVGFSDALLFWFGDDGENCFLHPNANPDLSDCPYWQVSVQFPDGMWLTATGLPSPEAYFILAPIFVSVLLSLLGITVVVALLTRRLTAPLRQLSAAADRVGRGEDVEALSETGPRELSSVMTAFNVMQERISRFVHDRTMALAAVSHDLRTPITSLRLRAEFVDDEQLRDKIIESLDDMQVMVESFLTFARQDIAEEVQQDFDLVKMCKRMADETEGMMFESAEATCHFRGRRVGLQRALTNLVGNAIKYGGSAMVRLEVDETTIRITIDDAGKGVPEDMFEDIFAPFTRMDQARSVVEGSVGLGLSIARSIIRKHGGDIHPSNLPEGFRMTVTLPVSAK